MKKPLILSIFESSEEKLVEVAKCLEGYCDALELNLSCPNIAPGEKTGMTVGRDAKLVKSYAKAVKDNVSKPVIVKLSPNPYIDDREKFREIVLAAAGHCDAISAINTIAGGMTIDINARKPVLAAKYGGLSGKPVKPIAVGCVYTIYETLSKNGFDIPIIGLGGISTAEDVIEFAEAGASAVGIGTAFMNKTMEDTGVYLYQLNCDLENLLKKMGSKSLKELVGAAHD